MIRAEIELGGQLEVVFIEAESKSKAIENIWDTYGYMTYIIGVEEIVDDTKEAVDGKFDSDQSADTD